MTKLARRNHITLFFFLSTVFLFFSVFSQETYSLGLFEYDTAPVYYEPGLQLQRYYELHGTDKDVLINLTGPLSEYATVTKNIVKADDSDRGFYVKIAFPKDKRIEPGNYKIYIKTLELSRNGGETIGTAVNILNGIRIFVMYPEPFLKIDSISVPNININESLDVTLWATSFCYQDINSANTIFKLVNSENQVLSTKNSESILIKSKETGSWNARFDTTGLPAGFYSVSATVNYGEKSTSTSKDFKIGGFNVNIVNYSSIFESGKFNKFWIDVSSGWNGDMNNIYAVVTISNGTQEQVIRTPSITLGPWEDGRLENYFDATNFIAGEYPIDMIVYYDDLQKSHSGKIIVIEPAPTEEIKHSGLSMPSTTTILVIVILVIVVLDIVWIVWKKKKDKKQ